MNKKSKFKVTPAVIKTLLFLMVAIIGTLAVFSVMSNNKKRSLYNVVATSPEGKDRYYINEPIHMGKGSVIVSNVEEFGPSNTNIAAIVHYYNTTDKTQVFRIRDLGVFTDGSYNFTMVTQDDREHMFSPGDSGLFKVELEREEGVDGLWFYTSEELKSEENDNYQAIVLLDTQRDKETILEEKLALGIDPDSDYLDLSLPENQHLVQNNSIKVGEDGVIVTTGESVESESGETDDIGINRNLTTKEREAMATRMTDAEVQEALGKVSLPGLEEWGPLANKKGVKGSRNVEGLPVLTQQEYFSATSNQDLAEGLKSELNKLGEDGLPENTDATTAPNTSEESGG